MSWSPPLGESSRRGPPSAILFCSDGGVFAILLVKWPGIMHCMARNYLSDETFAFPW
jgi:hypothetical protein